MTTLLELDHRVTALEQYAWKGLSVRGDAMNSALGQTYTNTQVTLQDLAGIRVEIARLEAVMHTLTATIKGAVDLRMSEVRHELRSVEASIRHDVMKLSEVVNRRFDEVDERFEDLEEGVDMIPAEIQSIKAGSST
jgi:uncharacterized protein (DUF885 family)